MANAARPLGERRPPLVLAYGTYEMDLNADISGGAVPENVLCALSRLKTL
jgi:hypothetical protein